MRAYEPEQWMRLVDEYRITGGSLAPTMVNFLLQHPKIREYDLSSSRGIGYGAAAMPVEVLRSAIDRFGPIVYSGFGMTELGGNVLTFPRRRTSAPSTATSTSSRRAARRCASPTSRSSTKT